MIKIRLDDNYTLCVSGHSLLAAHGHDIVCAGVSTLFWTYYYALKEHGIDTLLDADNGFGRIEPVVTEQNEPTVNVVCQTTMAGLHAIAVKYPGNVEICS